ncbi:hypothetical protein [Persephonella sp.]|uniref:hypothetical protein n=1 Tax=Persephonella sp. TaxID=2060922 RepID=UPI00260FF449|nr:hypothetical protein [Persephonella sp.]
MKNIVLDFGIVRMHFSARYYNHCIYPHDRFIKISTKEGKTVMVVNYTGFEVDEENLIFKVKKEEVPQARTLPTKTRTLPEKIS